MKKPIALILFLIFSLKDINSEEVSMTDFEDRTIYTNVLEAISRAVNEENIDEYSKHFIKFSINDRRKLALFFMEHSPSATILEKHVIHQDESSMEIAIRYSIELNGLIKNVNSIVFMKYTDEGWKVFSERLTGNKNLEPSYSTQEEYPKKKKEVVCDENGCRLVEINAFPLIIK